MKNSSLQYDVNGPKLKYLWESDGLEFIIESYKIGCDKKLSNNLLSNYLLSNNGCIMEIKPLTS